MMMIGLGPGGCCWGQFLRGQRGVFGMLMAKSVCESWIWLKSHKAKKT